MFATREIQLAELTVRVGASWLCADDVKIHVDCPSDMLLGALARVLLIAN